MDKLFDSVSSCLEVTPEEVPQPMRELLHHNKHMTLTLEAFLKMKVSLVMLQSAVTEFTMVREILLQGSENALPVQYAVAKVYLDTLDAAVRADIIQADIPIGHVLVKHDVQREVHCDSLHTVTLCDALSTKLGFSRGFIFFGRKAHILCNGKRAIDLLEVILPNQDFTTTN